MRVEQLVPQLLASRAVLDPPSASDPSRRAIAEAELIKETPPHPIETRKPGQPKFLAVKFSQRWVRTVDRTASEN